MQSGITGAKRWMAQAGWTAALGAVLLSGSSAFAQTLRDGIRQVFVTTSAEEPARETRVGEFWIGVVCEDVPASLRAQLELPENQGVLLADVVADGPAARAGLKQHDLLLTVNDKPLAQAQDVADAVAEGKDNELTLRLLRGGKEQTIAVKPEKRPAQGQAEGAGGQGPDERAMLGWLRRHSGEGPWRMRFFNPGMVLPPGAAVQVPLPKDMSVAITRQGEEPAKILVKQGDKSWEVTEDKLQELPDEVRGHVERMLGHAPQALNFTAVESPQFDYFVPAEPVLGKPAAPEPARVRVRRFDGDERIHKQLDDMRKQIEELKGAVEKLQKPE